MRWLRGLGLVAGLSLVAGLGLAARGAHRWTAATRTLSGKLDAGQARCGMATHFDQRELDGLPAPVQRYFRTALTPGQPLIAAASIALAGTFNLSASGARWKPFTSTQRVITQRPGFLWDAHIAMLPGLTVRVVDSYIAGEGLLHASLLGLFTLAEVQGGGEIARGELMRFLAEMAWYPTALLPSQGVRWEPVDERSAKATLVDGPLALTLLFRFGDDGLIDSFRAEMRGAMVGKEIVMTPWEGSWSDYQRRDGMLVPLSGEVAWMRPEGRRPYFRGTVTSLEYAFTASRA
ncbi:hypothetical protein RCH09_003423 [Actimicrobium sp. GrIS 1.19]|uniref:DUF6920 family protein n=1 Tax=Actimicrobium sp. GrIS 1.19 TaxID=3071708 RepID=UPI002DF84161|nr:hypothetical protein [Actimicrobium sp. GrIS 1.19]